MILLRGIAFPTSVFDMLLFVIALGVGLFVLYWGLIILSAALSAIWTMAKYALTGRWSEYMDKYVNNK